LAIKKFGEKDIRWKIQRLSS